ncbi:MAG: hypothetical protein D6748_05285 [Calditrichaeota bacterium]|nr:MAG: hypothetical protein D6748_05285 [Calditrichota bacterium]
METTLETLIYQLETSEDHQQRLELLAKLSTLLENISRTQHLRSIISLLYHRDWYIRREAAFLIDRLGIRLNDEERLHFEFALQHFDFLKEQMDRTPLAREILFNGCLDPSERFRSRLTAVLSREDCKTSEELARLIYATGDYQGLIELGCDKDHRPAVIRILQHGLKPENNTPYHRKQCAFCLQQLKVIDDAGEYIEEIIRSQSTKHEPDSEGEEEPPARPLTPLEEMLQFLNQEGIYLDGEKVYPEIRIGSVTHRITYRNPGLQTLPESDRLRRITPSPDHLLLRYDYIAIEPTLLFHFLLYRFLISMEDIGEMLNPESPQSDPYLLIYPADRGAAKAWLNAVINGGGQQYARQLTPFQMRLWEAIQELRQELLHQAYREGGITTIAGNMIPLDKNETNLGGKAMNRLVQGSASDIFNHACVTVHQYLLREHLPARIYFLLYDEVWIECEPSVHPVLRETLPSLLESVNQTFSLLLPLRVREKTTPEDSRAEVEDQ